MTEQRSGYQPTEGRPVEERRPPNVTSGVQRQIIRGRTLLSFLVDAGWVSKECRRVVIEASADGVVSIYEERFGTDALLKVTPPTVTGATVEVKQ